VISPADVATPAPTAPKYSLGQFVYTKPGRGEGAPRLSRIESAHPLHSNDGQIWLVRERMRSGWASAPLHRHIDRALNDQEVAHCRRLDLIPPHGQPL
jgi:hypothetical protein